MNKYLLFIIDSFIKLVLQVFGASGAIWGTSEVLLLRKNETQELWRDISRYIGIIFFIRFIIEQIKSYRKIHPLNDIQN